jgi:outer membrane protein assembly factor BamB
MPATTGKRARVEASAVGPSVPERGPRSRRRAGGAALGLVAAVGCGLGLSGCDPASLHGPLAAQWEAKITGAVVAKPTVAQGSVYIGGWNTGHEFAFDEASGRLRWETNLGTTTGFCPAANTQGIASSPVVQNGTAYLGGGDVNWYALNATTGAVQWSFPVAAPPAAGNFNYSSPLVYNGHAYVGLASMCDSPLVQGKLLRVNLATHQIENVWKAVPDGRVGGTIWTNPVVDSATNRVFLTTGTRQGTAEPYAQAIVSLDATTLALQGAWSPPVTVGDQDWGTTPTLFTGAGGRQLVGGVDKDGIFYALDRNNLSAGPVWSTRIARGGPCPSCGDGSISTAYFDGQRVLVAGGHTTIAGRSFEGSVRALDPATGVPRWEVGFGHVVLGALVGQNGMVVVPENAALYVLDDATGRALYANDLQGLLDGPATLADGHLFIGTVPGRVSARVFPAQLPPAQRALAAPSGSGAARARSARRSEALGTAAMCAASCRLTLGPRCTALRADPRGPHVIRAVRARMLGRHRRGARLRIFANGACAGTPALTLRVKGGGVHYKAPAPITVPVGGRASVTATRILTLRTTLVGGPGRSAARRPVHARP